MLVNELWSIEYCQKIVFLNTKKEVSRYAGGPQADGWCEKRRFATADDVMMFIMWPGLPRRRSVGTCDGVVTAPAGHSGAQ